MDWIQTLTEFFNKASPIILLLSVFVGFLIKLIGFVKKLKQGKEELWKERMVRKILKSLGTGQIMDILLILTDLLRVIPAEDLINLIIEFREKYDLRQEIDDTVLGLKNLLKFEKTVITRPVNEIISTYRDRKQIASDKKKAAVIINKKRWERIKHDKRVKAAMDGILGHYVNIRKNIAEEAKKKARVKEIEEKIAAMTSEENILKNRAKRHFIETESEKYNREEERKKLEKMKIDLHDIFSACAGDK